MPKVIPEYKEEARKKIIAAGWDVMSRKGYYATTMDDIAAQVGVTKSALYLYFRNKDDLLVEIVKAIPASIRQQAGKSFPNAPPLTGWTSMLDLQLGNDPGQDSLFLEMVAMMRRNPAVGKSLPGSILIGNEIVAHGIAAQQRKGLIRGDADPHTLALAIVALFYGFRCLSLAGVEHDEIRERWLEIGEILLQPVGTPADCREGCPWTQEMGRRLAERDTGQPVEIPVCPETCPEPECTIRRYEKKNSTGQH
jgi:AcrR family transcriptional regulator